MATMTISLPDQIMKLIDTEFRQQGFSTRSEFIRNLLRQYLLGEREFEPFIPRPLEEIKLELAKTGKYSQKFIESVVKGISKSSLHAR